MGLFGRSSACESGIGLIKIIGVDHVGKMSQKVMEISRISR